MSDRAFTKVFSSIIHSTIWRAPDHVRLVWITMLVMADADGYVGASVPGIADAARVSVNKCKDALLQLQAPDPDSRNPANEGRRIAPAERGWQILNYKDFREVIASEAERERKRRWWIENRGKNASKPSGA